MLVQFGCVAVEPVKYVGLTSCPVSAPYKVVVCCHRTAIVLSFCRCPGNVYCFCTALLYMQAMMELGATVCKPVNPLCDACPVSACCAAYKQVGLCVGVRCIVQSAAHCLWCLNV